jgi:hypothetical protein
MSSDGDASSTSADGQPETSRPEPVSQAQSEQARFECKGQLVRAIYAAFYARHMLLVRHKSANWPRFSPLWDGGVFRGQHYESIWPEVAQFIHRLRLPYFEFVRQSFWMCSRTPPPPDALLSDVGAKLLRQEIAEFRRQYAITLRTEARAHMDVVTRLQQRVDAGGTGHPLEQTWYDGRSPLFLFCFSVRYRADSHIRRYRRDAIKQYLQCPYAYKREWAVIMPKGLYRRALTKFGVELPEPMASSLPSDADQLEKE